MSEIDTTLQRYWSPAGGRIEPHGAGLLYLRADVDAVIAALTAERDALKAGAAELAEALRVVVGSADAADGKTSLDDEILQNMHSVARAILAKWEARHG